MAWSTSELARLAQTTTSTIRHYHRLGLLDDPERRSNGYKQYSAVHLVRLLQIRRLADRGIRLTAIGRILRDDADSAAALEQVDIELKASMRELARARRDLAAIREHRARADTPRGFEELSTGLSERQRSLLALFATVMSPAGGVPSIAHRGQRGGRGLREPPGGCRRRRGRSRCSADGAHDRRRADGAPSSRTSGGELAAR